MSHTGLSFTRHLLLLLGPLLTVLLNIIKYVFKAIQVPSLPLAKHVMIAAE